MNEQKLAEIAAIFAATGDTVQERKLQQLQEKLQTKQFKIAFCGHFSAGKSSLINKLCGYPLLPSSPIPTSANIVTILQGSEAVKVTYAKPAMGRVDTITLAELSDFCRNGTEIESVEISYPIAFLGEFGQLLDTPGIDSTDAAHQLSTESALHLADVIFYVMDYNHVQSEINLSFTKRMKDWGKPLYLIVNQIDKHNPHELSFASFRQDVEQSFLNWQVEPDGILYTTIKVPNHPENEWGLLVWLMDQLLNQAEPLRKRNFQHSLQQLIKDHGQVRQDLHEAEKENLRNEWLTNESMEAVNAEELEQQEAEIKQRIALLQELPNQLLLQWKKDFTAIIDNANLIPAATRALAHHYLTSRKPGFKLGLFSRASQTVKEIEQRLYAFHTDFFAKVQADLSWHLKDFVKKIAEQHAKDSEIPAFIAQLDFQLPPQWLAEQVNTGAVFSNEYTLTYARLVSAEIKAMSRKQGLAILTALQANIQADGEVETEQLLLQSNHLANRLHAYHSLRLIEQDEQSHQLVLHKHLQAVFANSDLILPNLLKKPNLSEYVVLHSKPINDRELIQATAAAAKSTCSKSTTATSASIQLEIRPIVSNPPNHRMKLTAIKLKQAAEIIGDIPAMKSFVKSLLAKSERLHNNRFTIALFGAFSAGKSSFANALIGENILPVSPNPTTASITTIVPPSEEWPHGSVRVKMKSTSFIKSEIQYSLEVLGIHVIEMNRMLDEIAKLSPDQVTLSGKPHYSFLLAVKRGWKTAETLLGQELRIDFTAFAAYVSEEEKSCFIDFIALHYANPLTDQGVVFVDTPGADSIHARHTGVAFNYIKNADAILFVTYYNHAFSQADRQFLLQLGRVKDSFEMDKMFFIINAIDLATDAAELTQVVDHLNQNLVKQGIRQARIYPVSSRLALSGKRQNNTALLQESGIDRFEYDFNTFTLEEITQVAIHSAEREITRSITVLQDWMDSAREDEQLRIEKLTMLRVASKEASDILLAPQYSVTLENELTKEIQELLYYVKQRVNHRLGEFYNLAFNPSSLREDARELAKALQSAWAELKQLLSYELSQEVLAASLRVEQFINRLLKKCMELVFDTIIGLFPTFQEESYVPVALVTPEIGEQVDDTQLNSKWLVSIFKNGKYFFEGTGKQQLRSELEPKLTELIHRFVDQHYSQLASTYCLQLEENLRDRIALRQQAILEHYEGLRDALEMKLNEADLIAKQDQLRSLLSY